MCRMMGMVGAAPRRDALEEFRALAGQGNVLPGNSCGHGDGWGLAGYSHGALAFFEKSGLSAVEDDRYARAEETIEQTPMDIFIGHLRKASVGDINAGNAHPFHRDGITFCHNGGVKQSEALPTYGLVPEGETDSERFFLHLLGRLKCGEASSLQQAAEQAAAYVHAHHRYSSISFLVTDGRDLYAYRDYRTELQPGETPPDTFGEWSGYYTLFTSPSARAVSSQPLLTLASDWTLMENRALVKL